MRSGHGFKIPRRVADGRHSRNQLRQKGTHRTLPLFARADITLALPASGMSVSRDVFGRRRPQTRENEKPRKGGHDGR